MPAGNASAAPVTLVEADGVPPYVIQAELDDRWAFYREGQHEGRFWPVASPPDFESETANQGMFGYEACARLPGDWTGAKSVARHIATNYRGDVVSVLSGGVHEITAAPGTTWYPPPLALRVWIVPIIGGGCLDITAWSTDAHDAARTFALSARVELGIRSDAPPTPNAASRTTIRAALKQIRTGKRPVTMMVTEMSCDGDGIAEVDGATLPQHRCTNPVRFPNDFAVRMRARAFELREQGLRIPVPGVTFNRSWRIIGTRAWTRVGSRCWKPVKYSTANKVRSDFLNTYVSFDEGEYRFSAAPGARLSGGDRVHEWMSWQTLRARAIIDRSGALESLEQALVGADTQFDAGPVTDSVVTFRRDRAPLAPPTKTC